MATVTPVAKLPRNGNPGIVPAYLANPAAPGPKATPAQPVKLAPASTPTPVKFVSHLEAAKAIAHLPIKPLPGMQPLSDPSLIGKRSSAPAKDVTDGVLIRLPDGRIYDVPEEWVDRRPSAGGDEGYYEEQEQQYDLDPAEKRKAIDTLNGVQAFYTKLGVTAREGNGDELDIQFRPDFGNAAYMRDRHGEHLIIGTDPTTGNSFAGANDVLAHEYSHRVMDNMIRLGHKGESGVVNESLADVFAAAVDQEDWTIGEDVHSGGVRDMQFPDRRQDAQNVGGRLMTLPAHMDDYLDLPEDKYNDYGGVHINMGIPNKAASIIGEALGRDTMAKIYIDAVRNYMPEGAGIADTARATLAAAKKLGTREYNSVLDAWDAVGLVDRNSGESRRR